jgi:hypothetical protein
MITTADLRGLLDERSHPEPSQLPAGHGLAERAKMQGRRIRRRRVAATVSALVAVGGLAAGVASGSLVRHETAPAGPVPRGFDLPPQTWDGHSLISTAHLGKDVPADGRQMAFTPRSLDLLVRATCPLPGGSVNVSINGHRQGPVTCGETLQPATGTYEQFWGPREVAVGRPATVRIESVTGQDQATVAVYTGEPAPDAAADDHGPALASGEKVIGKLVADPGQRSTDTTARRPASSLRAVMECWGTPREREAEFLINGNVELMTSPCLGEADLAISDTLLDRLGVSRGEPMKVTLRWRNGTEGGYLGPMFQGEQVQLWLIEGKATS